MRERFGSRVLFLLREGDIEQICDYIEMTRFPIPKESQPPETNGFGMLVRSADLIGQLSDPRYLQKIPALFYEFIEYRDSLEYLDLSPEGRQWVANLYANLARIESTTW